MKLSGIWNEFLDLKVVKENCGGQSLVSHPTIPTLLCSHPCLTPPHEGRQGLWLLTSSLRKRRWDVTLILHCYVRFPFSVLNHGFCEVNKWPCWKNPCSKELQGAFWNREWPLGLESGFCLTISKKNLDP